MTAKCPATLLIIDGKLKPETASGAGLRKCVSVCLCVHVRDPALSFLILTRCSYYFPDNFRLVLEAKVQR